MGARRTPIGARTRCTAMSAPQAKRTRRVESREACRWPRNRQSGCSAGTGSKGMPSDPEQRRTAIPAAIHGKCRCVRTAESRCQPNLKAMRGYHTPKSKIENRKTPGQKVVKLVISSDPGVSASFGGEGRLNPGSTFVIRCTRSLEETANGFCTPNQDAYRRKSPAGT